MSSTVKASAPAAEPREQGPNFIEAIIEEDNRTGVYGGQVVTRFPPEPNGYLHIGHAKSICLNFGLGLKYGGRTHMRFDDTNPLTEEPEFVESILGDVRWLGFDWGTHLHYASDYFEQLYRFAEELIKLGRAYVCSLTAEQISEYRGDFFKPGRDSPFRQRSVDENLALFRDMRAGIFQDGQHTLRLKIDMSAGNPNLRDPPIYRIRRARHHRTGDAWCIYPLYDYTHCISDAIEGITHSICTLEFEAHRALYDWVLAELKNIPPGASVAPPRGSPKQIEFGRLNLTYTVMSKRKLLRLVNEGHVEGWDDPRMLTIAGLRRRGFTPASVRNFAALIGVTKNDAPIDMSVLENAVREDLNASAPRALAVLRPLKVVLENWPAGDVDHVDLVNHPLKPELGTRKVPFGRELYIDAEDFEEQPPKGFFRLAPGKEVRLRGAYFITCTAVKKDAGGKVVELTCTVDRDSRGGEAKDGRKVKGTIHWVSAAHAVDVRARLYDRLFSVENPDDTFLEQLNPHSLDVVVAKAEPSLAQAAPGTHVQLERVGYFFADPKDSKPGAPVWNRVVGLKDSWSKEKKKG
ncbi:MAG: glutamine--tRNA ligase/YqeY domain fusion protein [Deltaproteobacteria bacterium]|nr:glutamine--tRNA ligase/YqeY domain fusion protein [Deltaproteobacteria bacterium]